MRHKSPTMWPTEVSFVLSDKPLLVITLHKRLIRTTADRFLPLSITWFKPQRCKAINIIGQVSEVSAVCVPDTDTCTFKLWINTVTFPQVSYARICIWFLPGATVTVGNMSNTVFLMIWKPKDLSSEELTGKGSNPSTSSIFTRWSPTVDWMRCRT